MNHPALWDDRGSVFVIDLNGHLRQLTPDWGSEDGLAWRADGKEIWFTGVSSGIRRDLVAVTLDGKRRKILELPASMTLQDMAPDGRILVSLDNERVALASSARDGKPVNLSGTTGALRRTFRGTDNRFCLRTPAKPRDHTTP